MWSWLEDLREAPRDEWERLLRLQARPSPFMSPDFLLPWYSSFAAPAPMRVGVWRPRGQTRGMIFLYQGQVWELCGGQDVADRLDALIAPGSEPEFWTELFGQAREPLSLPNVAEDSALLQFARSHPAGFQVTRTDSAPFLTLPATFDAYLAQLSKKHRHELRRKMRRAEPLRYRCATDIEELPTFFTLHRLSLPLKEEFMEPRMESFFTEICGRFAQRGQLRIGFLLQEEEAIASMLQFDFDGKIQLYNSGYNPAHAHLSPGVVLLAHCIEQAIEERRTEYDFLRGTERYKYDLGGRDRGVFRVTYDPCLKR